MRWVLAVAMLAACHHAGPEPLVVEISASLPGARPATIAAAVTAPLERALGQLPHLRSLASVTTAGATELRAAFDGTDVAAAQQAVQGALNAAAQLLPREMPVPPSYAVRGPLLGRYLVANRDADYAALRASQVAAVGRVETCGERVRELQIEIDPVALAAVGMTMTEVRKALVAAGSAEVRQLVIGYRNGAKISLADVAKVVDGEATPACLLVAADPDLVELAIYAQTPASLEVARAGVAATVGTLGKQGIHLIAMPPQRELHAELGSDVTPEKAAHDLRGALAPLGDGTLAEVRGASARVLTTSPAALHALTELPIVVTAGEPTGTVHVSGADPAAVAAAARAIADRLRAASLLVGTRGLATHQTLAFDLNRETASRLGVSANDLDDTLADATGRIAATIFSGTDRYNITLRAPSRDELYVRATGGALVPVSAIVRTSESLEPIEVLHRGQFPDVDLEVHGDPRAAIGAVPADVHVEVE